MALKFKVDVSGMDTVKEAIAKACTKAEHKVAGQVLSDTAPFVPAAGNAAGLTNRARVVGNSVIYPGPYARYLYYGKLIFGYDIVLDRLERVIHQIVELQTAE